MKSALELEIVVEKSLRGGFSYGIRVCFCRTIEFPLRRGKGEHVDHLLQSFSRFLRNVQNLFKIKALLAL